MNVIKGCHATLIHPVLLKNIVVILELLGPPEMKDGTKQISTLSSSNSGSDPVVVLAQVKVQAHVPEHSLPSWLVIASRC